MSTPVAASIERSPEAVVTADGPAEVTALSAAAEAIAAGGLPPLAVPRAHAVGYLRQQFDKGVAIYRLRIHHVEDLDECRAKKLGWTIETSDLLTRLFGCTAVADFCNDWVGKIHPEYAEFGNFVEQFYEEMTHRLQRLREVQNRLDTTRASAGKAIRADMAVRAATTREPAAAPEAVRVESSVSRQSTPATAGDQVLLALDAQAEQGQQVAKFLEQLGISVTATTDVTAESGGNHGFALLPTLPDHGDIAAVFRLGFTAGRLGQERVCVLNSSPDGAGATNAFGLSHVTYDAGGGWRLDLARMLKRAGFPIDLNRLCA